MYEWKLWIIHLDEWIIKVWVNKNILGTRWFLGNSYLKDSCMAAVVCIGYNLQLPPFCLIKMKGQWWITSTRILKNTNTLFTLLSQRQLNNQYWITLQCTEVFYLWKQSSCFQFLYLFTIGSNWLVFLYL